MDTYAGDSAEVSFRLGTFRAGIGPSFLATVYGIAYALWTWDHPHRAALLILFVQVTISAVVVLVLPLEAVVRSRQAKIRSGHLLPWSRAPYGYRAHPECPQDARLLTI